MANTYPHTLQRNSMSTLSAGDLNTGSKEFDVSPVTGFQGIAKPADGLVRLMKRVVSQH